MKNQNNYLEHHGVKGQKWGVRKESEVEKEHKVIDKEITEIKQQDSVKKQTEKKKMSKTEKIILGGALVAAGAIVTLALIAKYGKQKPSSSSSRKTRAKTHIPGSSADDVVGKGWNNDPYVKKGAKIVDGYAKIKMASITMRR